MALSFQKKTLAAACAVLILGGQAIADEPSRPQDGLWNNSVCGNPVLTRSAISRRAEGHVSVLFDINEDGRVKNIRITDSEPKGLMDGPVKRALRRWEYFLYFVGGTEAARKDVSLTFTFGEAEQKGCTHTTLPELPSTAGDPSDPYVQLKKCFTLVMPRGAAQRRETGEVTLGYDITPEGTVTNATVLGATPAGTFDQTALRSLGRWGYHEFEKAGIPIERKGLQVSFYFGDLPQDAPDHPCGFAGWDSTDTVTKIKLERRRAGGTQPGKRSYTPGATDGKSPTPK